MVNIFPCYSTVPMLYSMTFTIFLVAYCWTIGGGTGWLIEHLMWQRNLIEKSVVSDFLGCGLFQKECEVFSPHPPRRAVGTSSPGGHRGLGLVFQLRNGSRLTCGAVISSTWAEGGGSWASTGGRSWEPPGTHTVSHLSGWQKLVWRWPWRGGRKKDH